MKRLNYPKTSPFRTLRFTLAASVLTVAMNLSADEGVVVTTYPNSLTAAVIASQASSIELRMAGPGGYRLGDRGETGAPDWYPGGLADGEYRCEVFVHVGNKQEKGAANTTRLYRENVRFKVEGGTVFSVKEAVMPPLPDVNDHVSIESGSWYEKLANNLLDFLVSPATGASLVANPGDVYIIDSTPYMYWNDTDTTGTDWYMSGSEYGFGLVDNHSGISFLFASINPAFSLRVDGSRFYLYNNNFSDYSIYLDHRSGADVLRANANGDIELADGSVFIDKSVNFLGVGTMIPTDDIHVVSTSPALLLDETSGGDIRVQNSSGEFSIGRSNGNYNGFPFTIENDKGSILYPGVGIWEIDPEVSLHVNSHDGMSAGLLVENISAPTAAGDVVMFNLRNTGDKIVRFAIEAGDAGSVWTFDNEPTYNSGAGANSGRFRIAKSGTGVTEFSVDGYGNGRFYGNSYAVNHVNTSSRDSKTDFTALNERDVLDRLMQLPVSQWRYKQESKENRHIGPVAEDFQQAFGLGDGKHISTVDSEGIALAAIKAVKAEKDAEIAALKAESAALAKQNQALSERLRALEDLLLDQHPVSAR